MARTLFLQILDRVIEVRSESERGRSLLLYSYGHLETATRPSDLVYSLEDRADSGLLLRRKATSIAIPRAEEHLLSLFDDDLVVQLQYLRPDLYFEHAAVVALGDKAYLMPAPPGSGKSTLAWALLQHGLRYSSDELGPIDPKTMTVAPFSRALCLKENPGAPYEVPDRFDHGYSTLHLPVGCLTQPPIEAPTPLSGVFFPRFDSAAARPRLHEIGTAAGAARLYSNALNPLAHPGNGLDTALELASQIPCYELTTSSLPATCELVLRTMGANS